MKQFFARQFHIALQIPTLNLCNNTNNSVESIAETQYIKDKENLATSTSVDDNALLVDVFPDIIKYLDIDNNGKAKQDQARILANSKKKYKCKCRNEHSFLIRPIDIAELYRAGRELCPYCDGRAKIPKFAPPLSQSHPHIAKHWDPNANVCKEPPDKVTAFTQTPYMWICENGHSFRLSPCKYVRFLEEGRSPCQYCRGRRAYTNNSLKALYPDIAKELAPDNEKAKSADRISPDSKTNYYWICRDKGHRYVMSTVERIQYYKRGEAACPYCSGRAVIPGETSITALFPDIVAMWDKEENGPETNPDNIAPSSTIAYAWKCQNGHKFKASPKKLIYYMSKNIDLCPYCGERLVSPEENSLAARHPDIAAEWCYEKNTGLNDPAKVYFNSLHVYWWKCSQGHIYSMTVSGRVQYKVSKKEACPYCDGRKAYWELSLLETYPDIAADWCYEKNTNSKGPSNISPYSTAGAWWECPDCKHLYKMRISDRVEYKVNSEIACPYCSERRLKREDSLGVLHPDIANEWIYEDNLPSKGPMYISPESRKYFNWKCSEGHVYRMSPAKRIRYKEAGLISCPICDDRPVLELDESNNLAAMHPDIAAFWDYERNVGFAGPHRVHYLATSTYAWKCELGHRYQMTVTRQIELKEAGIIACPYCGDRKVLPGFNSFAVKHPDLLPEWDDDIDPDTVSERSQTQVGWKCSEHSHSYTMPIGSRVNFKLAGKTACPYCDDRQVLPGFNSFAARHPDLLPEWDYVNNYALADPDKIAPNSNIEVWFICKNDPSHRYPTTVFNRVYNKIRKREPCPYCKGRMRKRAHYMPIQKTKTSS